MTSIRTIAAIPTIYHGIEFRSRLEARWAFFFEKLGLRWEYEPEGFFLGEEQEYDPALMYLPDFLVLTPQDEEMWFEIKPINITEDEKFTKFVQLIHKPKNKEEEEEPWRIKDIRTMLLSGQPKDLLVNHRICPRCGFFLDKESYKRFEPETCFYCWECDTETPSGGNDEYEKNSVCSERGIFCRQSKGSIIIDDWDQAQRFYNITQTSAEFSRRHRFD